MKLVRFVCLFQLMLPHSAYALEWRETADPDVLPELRIPYGASSEQPLIELKDHGNPAAVWIWAQDTGLSFRIRVQDTHFEPRPDDRWLWRGDGVYLEIDGFGDNPERFGMGADDLRLHLALSDTGPVGRVT